MDELQNYAFLAMHTIFIYLGRLPSNDWIWHLQEPCKLIQTIRIFKLIQKESCMLSILTKHLLSVLMF